MARQQHPDALLLQSIDHDILEVTFTAGSVGQDVEAALLDAIRYQADNAANYGGLAVRKRGLRSIRFILYAWRTKPSSIQLVRSISDGAALKDAAAKAVGSVSRDPEALENMVLEAFTMHLNDGGSGSAVFKEVVDEIMDAARKVYLKVSGEVQEQEQNDCEPSRKAHNNLPKGSMPQTRPSPTSANRIALFESASLLQPGMKGYDSMFPTLDHSPPHQQRAEIKAMSPRGKGGQATFEAALRGQPKISSVFRPVDSTEHADLLASSFAKSKRPAFSILSSQHAGLTVAPATPSSKTKAAVESVATSATPPSTSKSAGQGNHGHNGSVPWQEDEELFVIGIIIDTRNNLTWQQITDAVNEEFQDKPMVKDGRAVLRGPRKMQGTRQHKAFQGREWWCDVLDRQIDSAQQELEIDWRAEMEAMRERETRAYGVVRQASEEVAVDEESMELD